MDIHNNEYWAGRVRHYNKDDHPLNSLRLDFRRATEEIKALRARLKLLREAYYKTDPEEFEVYLDELCEEFAND